MVAKFQFYLDGNLVTDPKGWADLDTTIKRDQALYSLLVSQEAELTFFDNGYTYIKSVFDSQDFCSFVKIEVKQTCDQLNYETIFTGLIFLSEVKFSLEQCSVTTKTVDDGFYARIYNNRSIKAQVNVGRSKNDTAIAPANDLVVKFFYPTTGAYPAQSDRHCYRIFEVFKFLVSFISDGLIDFVSNDFDTGGQWEGVCITTGNEILNADQAKIPTISFQEAFTEINKKMRIGFAVEKINGRPTLRIENAEYFYSQSSAVTLSNAKDVTMQMDNTQLYSQVHLGSTKTDSLTAPVGSFPEDIRFIGFKDETYHVIGTCNIDLTLDLESSWIISSNIIEDIFFINNASYNDDIVLLNVDLGATNFAHQSNWITPTAPPPFFYNELFNNSNVTERWFKGIPNQIANFLGNSDDTFQATSTSDMSFFYTVDPFTFVPIKFQDDSTGTNHDVNNNYDPALFEFTAPQSGVYTLFSSMNIAFPVGAFVIDVKGFFDVYDAGGFAGGILLYSVQFAQFTEFRNHPPNLILLSGSSNFNMAIGTKAVVRMVLTKSTGADASIKISIKTGAIFSCLDSATGGGIVGTSSPANYKIKKYSFKYPITYNDLKTIKSDTKKLLTFTTNNGIIKTGWIDTIKYYHHDKPADVTLITNE